MSSAWRFGSGFIKVKEAFGNNLIPNWKSRTIYLLICLKCCRSYHSALLYELSFSASFTHLANELSVLTLARKFWSRKICCRGHAGRGESEKQARAHSGKYRNVRNSYYIYNVSQGWRRQWGAVFSERWGRFSLSQCTLEISDFYLLIDICYCPVLVLSLSSSCRNS